jgi:hypothetical protein
MAFGQKYDKDRPSGGGGDGLWIKRFPPKASTIRIRPLTEPAGWVEWHEVWDDEVRRGWPIDFTAGQTAQEHQDVRRRLLMTVLNVDDDQVWAFQAPKAVSDALELRFEMKGTITDSDFAVTKSGTGLETRYACGHDETYPLDHGKYTLPDLEKVLADAYQHAVNQGWASDVGEKAGPIAKTVEAEPASEEELDEVGLPVGWRQSSMSAIRELARKKGINPSGQSKAELIAALDGSDNF